MPLVVLVEVHVPEKYKKEFLQIANTDATKSVSEPGCIGFNVFSITDKKDHYIFQEIYDGQVRLFSIIKQFYVVL